MCFNTDMMKQGTTQRSEAMSKNTIERKKNFVISVRKAVVTWRSKADEGYNLMADQYEDQADKIERELLSLGVVI